MAQNIALVFNGGVPCFNDCRPSPAVTSLRRRAIMKNNSDIPAAIGSDINSLFSRFGKIGEAATYREVVRDTAAIHAALRWPLLAEVQGIEVPDPVLDPVPTGAGQAA